ncbi:MAG: polymerase primary sigma factor, partial [Mycobacteriales bacterium]
MSRPHRTQRTAVPADAVEPNAVVDEVEERVDLPDLDEQAAVSADLVRVYLNEIGKVALLNAAQEVDLAKRIEAGLYADQLLTDPAANLSA